MLKPERMVDDVLMALSMYFAAAIKDRLMRSGQDVWTLIMLLAGTMLWWKVETCCAASKHAQQTAPTDDLALFYDVAFEVVYIVSQTLTFLVLQFTVHLFDASVDEDALWMQSITLPSLLLLFCILLVVVTKRYRGRGGGHGG